MDIEVGDYIRTKEGKIGKFDYIRQDFINEDIEYYVINIGQHTKIKTLYRTIDVEEKDIIKHSKNIIDLIEDFDYVNGYLCRTIDGKMCNFDLNTMEWTSLENIDIWYNILTHEQYEKGAYKIE